ncbi:MAG: hypothetical protein KBC91_00605 [Candidatus Omnitrophica bacterium]|nr:hypothetical protein [Candidatus Omnitrophota bacterium]
MAFRPFKNYSQLFRAVLFAVLCWTYFQPAIRIQVSGIPASRWSAHQLACSSYHSARQAISHKKQPKIKIQLPTSFADFLNKLFPRKKQEPNVKAYAGLVFGILIPVTFLLAYLSLTIGMVISLSPAFKRGRFFGSAAFFLASYALAGILVLRDRAADLVQTSADQASRGVFGFIAKSFVQQISIEPGIALISLPALAAAFWLLAALRKK